MVGCLGVWSSVWCYGVFPLARHSKHPSHHPHPHLLFCVEKYTTSLTTAHILYLRSRIAGKEARRRITFFVNSLFVAQPEKRKILEMPSLTTLTPYYNEEVVRGA